jgi:general stress protein CsbA
VESRTYEFNRTQNELIYDLAQKMRFVSYFLITLGVLLIIGGLISVKSGVISGVINGTVQVLIGFWTHKAATSFQLIADTKGHDLENLLGGLGELRKLYTLEYWLIFIASVFMTLSIVIGLALGAFSSVS